MTTSCTFCGATASPGASHCPRCGAALATARGVAAPAATLLGPDGQLTDYGRAICNRVFDHFDADHDGALMLSELNALAVFCGDAPMEAGPWGLVLEAQGVALDARGYVPRDQYEIVFRYSVAVDPAAVRGHLARLGVAVPEAAFPPQPSPAQQQQLQQMLTARVQEAAARRAQMSQFFHNLNMSIIAGYPTGGAPSVGRCASCGAVKTGWNCTACGRW